MVLTGLSVRTDMFSGYDRFARNWCKLDVLDIDGLNESRWHGISDRLYVDSRIACGRSGCSGNILCRALEAVSRREVQSSDLVCQTNVR
jgi:hypothetical protein